MLSSSQCSKSGGTCWIPLLAMLTLIMWLRSVAEFVHHKITISPWLFPYLLCADTLRLCKYIVNPQNLTHQMEHPLMTLAESMPWWLPNDYSMILSSLLHWSIHPTKHANRWGRKESLLLWCLNAPDLPSGSHFKLTAYLFDLSPLFFEHVLPLSTSCSKLILQLSAPALPSDIFYRSPESS